MTYQYHPALPLLFPWFCFDLTHEEDSEGLLNQYHTLLLGPSGWDNYSYNPAQQLLEQGFVPLQSVEES